MLGKNKTSLGVFAFAAVLCSLLFAPGCGDDDKDKVDGQTPATPATTDVCTKGATKCGDGANAHILYTCKDGTAYDSGTDCAANDSHKICGGDAVKACVCDAAKGYVESSGTCACGTVNGIEYVDKNGTCERKKTCDKTGQKYDAASNSCVCNADAGWKGDDACTCNVDAGWTESGNACTCSNFVFQGQCIAIKGTVTFGNYTQANAKSKTPIEWIVLDANTNDKTLWLLSRNVLDVMEYHSEIEFPTWKNSDIRAWLNDASKGFMATAFSDTEQALIAQVTYKTSDNKDNAENKGGEDALDKVFLLDYQDTVNQKYFDWHMELAAPPTAYVVNKGILGSEEKCKDVKCDAAWWLRNPGNDADHATALYVAGDDGHDQSFTTSDNIGVRPSLWVKYE